MKFLYNDDLLKDRRRLLRKTTTVAENIVWQRLRKQQVGGLRFLRQYSVGSYILDFYSPKIRLAIEIDGHQHATSDGQAYDQERTDFLHAMNIKVLRFWNEEVIRDVQAVIKKIQNAIP